jgi:peptidoglycan/LPS O-acetylase OafA/YrhL
MSVRSMDATNGGQTITRPAPVSHRFPGFDGLRAIAAVTVFVFHMFNADPRPVAHGYGRYLALLNIGVPLFFVISGFLLYRPFVIARFAGRSRPSTREFLRRRVLRIVPGFWIAFTVLCIVFNVSGSPDRSWKWALVNYGLLQTFVETAARPGIAVAWTIGTEMTFYLLLPLYAALLARGTRTVERQFRRELIGIAALVLIAIAWRSWFIWGDVPRSWHWYTFQSNVYLPASTDFFGGGMLLAVLSAWHSSSHEPRWTRSRWLPAAAWGTAIAAYVFYVESISTWTNGGTREVEMARFVHHLLFVVIAVTLAIPAAFGERGKGIVRRALESRPMQIVALGSFGIYLYHLSMIKLVYWLTGAEHVPGNVIYPHGPDYPFVVMFVLAAIATGIAAALSYRFVEAPFLRRKRPMVASRDVSGAATTLPPSAPR